MTDLAILLTPPQGLLGFFQHERHQNEDQERLAEAERQEALKAMYLALVTTRKYTEAQPEGVDREKQLELSNLWATAAIKSRRYFQEAMPWNMTKAAYWLDDIKWPEEKVKAMGIDLVTVEAKIAELIQQ
jgi:hypothetical protein